MLAVALCSAAVGVSLSELDCNPVAWTIDSASGSVRANGLRDMAVLPGERCARMSFSALLQPEAGSTNGWSTMGLAFCDDEENYWHLALAQAPPDKAGRPGRRFFELVEMRAGDWLAQYHDHLVGTVGHKSSSWEYGQSYSLSLAVDSSGIRGEVRDAQGKIAFAARYAFPAPDAEGKVKAVTCGRPALSIKGAFKGLFAALDLHTSEPRPKPPMATSFPPYSPIGFDTGIREKPTGFFHVAKCADGRWWTIDPLGRGIVMTGVDHVKYQGVGSARTKRNWYRETNTRKYPDRSDWETNTLARLKAWGFNMLGGGCNQTLERRGLAHSRSLSLSNGVCLDHVPPEFYICPNEHRPCTAFPNVFHSKFGQYCDYVAQKKCAPNRDDPWLVGYYIDNELAWWGRGARDTGLFDAVAQLPDAHPARQAQRAFLAAKGVKEPVAAEVKLDFLRLAAERYFSATTAAIRRADPNHMVLGARFAGINGAHEEVWRIAARYCDAVTFNCYPWADIDRNEMRMHRSPTAPRMADAFAQLYEVTGRPLLVTEWSFPALDSGLPCTHGAGQRFPTQRLRVQASELFAKTLLALPFMLGYNYFMWVDEPPEGVSDAFPEDSNYGLVSEQDEPYPDLVSMFTRLHQNIGDWRRADIPAVRTPPPKASLLADEARARLSAGRGCACHREGDRYRVTNNASLVLEGRVGGSAVFDRVAVKGVELGSFNGMLSYKVGGKRRWRNLARVTAAEWRNDRLVVAAEGSEGSFRFAFTFAIAPIPDRPWFFCEVLEVKNIGTSPLEEHSVFLRQYVPYAADKAGNEQFRGVPNLWGAPLADAWFRQADEAYFGGFSCAPAATLFRYNTLQGGRTQHPDAVFTPLVPTTLAPGEKYVPNGTVWMVALGGMSGGRKAWDAALKELSRDLENTRKDLVLARRGQEAAATVVIRRDASPSERYAAEELVRYVEKMTSVRLPVIDDTQPLPARAVILGMTRHTSALAAGASATRELGDEGFRLLAVPPHLLVMGSHKRGVLYGVYELLETYGGVGWFASWHEVVPSRDVFAVPVDLDDTQTPTFVFRNPAWLDVRHHADFAVRCRMNGQSNGMEPRHGGCALRFVRHLGSAHTFDRLLPCAKWFRQHPEYFSEVNGARRDGRTQLCLTNPDVLRLVVSNVLAHIEADARIREDPVPINVAGVSPNDWRYYCRCAKCRAVDEEEGTQTGSLLRFVNRVAEEVEKVHPGFFIETLIYSYTRTPPRLARPRHNVMPCLCAYECSFAQPLAVRNRPVNAAFMDDLEKWGSYSDNLYLWDYTTDYGHYLYPMPNVLTLQPNIQTFRDNGVKYYSAEGGPYHADFAELKAWLIAKLSWNCDRPLAPLLEQFFSGYYGAAAPFVRQYFDEVESLLKRDPNGRLTIWDNDRPDVYTDEFIVRSRRLFRQAEEAVKDDPVRLMHVRRQEAVLVCVWLDRKGKYVKHFWATRHPERFDISPDLKEDVRWIMARQEESKKAGRPVPIANRPDKEERTFEIWRYIDEFKRPEAPSDFVALGVGEIHFGGRKFGRIVKDATAQGGKAIEAWNYAEGEAASVRLAHVAFDADALYRVRFHVRADAATNGRGEAFFCRLGGKTLSPRIEEMKEGWQWYEFGPRKLHEELILSFASGRFANGGGSPAVKGVRIDRVEIVRADDKPAQ